MEADLGKELPKKAKLLIKKWFQGRGVGFVPMASTTMSTCHKWGHLHSVCLKKSNVSNDIETVATKTVQSDDTSLGDAEMIKNVDVVLKETEVTS